MEDESDLESDLPVLYLTLVDVTTSLDELEPTKALDRLMGTLERLIDGILNRLG